MKAENTGLLVVLFRGVTVGGPLGAADGPAPTAGLCNSSSSSCERSLEWLED